MPEDKGIVPNRRAYDTPVGPREMLGPYDVDFERLEMLEQIIASRDTALMEQSGDDVRRMTRELLNLIFAEPFTEAEFKKLIPLAVTGWIDDFLADYERSSLEAANRPPIGDLSLPANSVPHSNGTTRLETL